MNVRVAVVADASRLVGLIRSAYRGEASREGWTSEADLVAGDRIDEPGVLALITAPGSVMLVLDDAVGLVACCQLEDRNDGVTYFGTFAVDPGAQGGGLGRRMMDEAEQWARNGFDAHTLEMTVLAQQEALIAYYERRGFVRTGEIRPFPSDPVFARPLRDDLTFVVLRKDLGSAAMHQVTDC